MEKKLYDINNVTASDYTVQMRVPKTLWEKYNELKANDP